MATQTNLSSRSKLWGMETMSNLSWRGTMCHCSGSPAQNLTPAKPSTSRTDRLVVAWGNPVTPCRVLPILPTIPGWKVIQISMHFRYAGDIMPEPLWPSLLRFPRKSAACRLSCWFFSELEHAGTIGVAPKIAGMCLFSTRLGRLKWRS